MTTRRLTPICGAARPAPCSARMVSFMSATSAVSSSSKRCTGAATCLSSGSPILSTGRTAMKRNVSAMVAEHERMLGRQRGAAALGAIHGLGHEVMMRREIAHRVRIRRVTRQQVSLAAAAAEVAPALRAAAAGLLHPVLAAVAVECRRVVPDGGYARLAYAREGQARQHSRGLAGQCDPIRREAEEQAS